MTFRQIIAVLWQRKWLIVAVIAVAMVVAGGYLALQVKTYSTTADVRTSVTVTNGASGGELDGVQVDFDPTTITSPKILKQVAAATGSTEADITNSITYVVTENKTTNTIEITATGPTPQQAQDRANSVVKVYSAYLQAQIDTALKTLTTRQATTNALAVQYEQEVNLNPRNSIAAANLNNALADLGTLNTQIQSLTDAGAPLTPLTDTALGTPVGPGIGIVLAIALATGLIAGIGIALIRDQFDNRLRGEHEIEPLTGLPSLGELRFDKSLRRSNESLPAAQNDQTQLSEGLRSLRTSLQVLLPRDGAVVVVTSVEPGDGKTFIAANVALAWARAGRKVIVVGGDLRRPTLSTYFGAAAEGTGLSEILRAASAASSADISDQVESHVVDTQYAGLRVLPAGFEASDPADLLATSSLQEIIHVLRKHADIVILDSPPALALIDASLLAEHADGVVVIASVGRTDRSALAATIDLLKQNGARTLGVVANRSKRRLPKTYAPYYLQNAASHPTTPREPFATSPYTSTSTSTSSSTQPAAEAEVPEPETIPESALTRQVDSPDRPAPRKVRARKPQASTVPQTDAETSGE